MEFLADMGGITQLGEFIVESAGDVGGGILAVVGVILAVVLFPFTVWMLIDCLKKQSYGRR
jgi:hypothetical protein